VAEEILGALAQIEGLRVAGRTSSFSFKGKTDDVRLIGDKLNLATVLEGSVRKEGNRVRISAQLLSAADGFHLWSQTYDRELTGIFAAQDEISKAVVDALKLQLVSRKEPARKREPGAEAHNEYLLGNQFINRQTYDNYLRATGAYERATKLDPRYAQAWAGLAMATFWVAAGADSPGPSAGSCRRRAERRWMARPRRPAWPVRPGGRRRTGQAPAMRQEG
jgi:serine/threonine-protein kinase